MGYARRVVANPGTHTETLPVVTQIPNLLTLSRLVAAPAIVMLLNYRMYPAALAVFIFAGISDGLDGHIAKRFDCQTRLGAILDPVADKVLLVSCFIMLTVLGALPFWLLVVVAFRDIVIVGGYLLLVTTEGRVRMQPSTLSKFNTVLQIVLVAALLLGLALDTALRVPVAALVAAVTVTTLLSGVHYVWLWTFQRGRAAPRAPGPGP